MSSRSTTALAMVAMLAAVSACTEWRGTIQVATVHHYALPLTSTTAKTYGQATCARTCSTRSVGSSNAPGAAAGDGFADCLAACPAAVEQPGRCVFDPSIACGEIHRVTEESIDGRCVDYKPDPRVVGCRDEKHTTVIGYIGAGLGLVALGFIALVGAAMNGHVH